MEICINGMFYLAMACGTHLVDHLPVEAIQHLLFGLVLATQHRP